VVEGTQSAHPSEEDWYEYTFKGQPVRTDERPRQWAPYHLRLDWQLWFAAMYPRPTSRQRWFVAFLKALLQNDEAVLALVDDVPFSDEPPQQVRVLRYRYRFTTPTERAETGAWWRRERVDTYVPAVGRADLGPGKAHP
jgi:hypothetical protein